MIEWPRVEDSATYQMLLDKILGGACALFLGSGPSQRARYPSWDDLIARLATAAKLEISREDVRLGGERALDIAETSRQVLGKDEFYQILEKEFRPGNKEYCLVFHEYLVEIPFCSYLTTNYDPLLENAVELMRIDAIKHFHVYPRLDATHLRNRHIYHLHGKAHDEQGRSTIRTVRITSRDYADAYDNRMEIRSILYQAYAQEITVLFVGFGFGDPALTRVLKASWQAYESVRNDWESMGLGRLPERTHFAFMPAILASPGKEQALDTSEASRNKEAERDEDRHLRELGVETMRYLATDRHHRRLEDIVRDLRNRTVIPSPHRPPKMIPVRLPLNEES